MLAGESTSSIIEDLLTSNSKGSHLIRNYISGPGGHQRKRSTHEGISADASSSTAASGGGGDDGDLADCEVNNDIGLSWKEDSARFKKNMSLWGHIEKSVSAL